MLEEEDILDDDSLELEEYLNDDEILIHTHEKINSELCGKIEKLEKESLELRLKTIPEMLADSKGLIHGGFIFSAADYAAMALVNERNVVLVASNAQFLSPVRLGDEVHFTATVRHKEGRKRNVHVTAHVLDIKVFEGEFKTVITDRHVLKLNLLEEDDNEDNIL